MILRGVRLETGWPTQQRSLNDPPGEAQIRFTLTYTGDPVEAEILNRMFEEARSSGRSLPESFWEALDWGTVDAPVDR